MKYLIRLVVPSINASFEILIPDFLLIRDISALLSVGVAELSGNTYVPSGEESLCMEQWNHPLDGQRTLLDYGIGHGDTLYLI